MSEARSFGAVNAYSVLQVDPSAIDDVIHAAYRALARHHHPDLAPDQESSDQMAMINRAYELVRTPDRRATYDRQRAPRASPEQQAEVAPHVTRSRFRRVAEGEGAARVDFGRYRGWSLSDLAEHDPDYLRWLKRHSGGVRYRREIERVLAAARPVVARGR